MKSKVLNYILQAIVAGALVFSIVQNLLAKNGEAVLGFSLALMWFVMFIMSEHFNNTLRALLDDYGKLVDKIIKDQIAWAKELTKAKK
jgi:hypothetical protein